MCKDCVINENNRQNPKKQRILPVVLFIQKVIPIILIYYSLSYEYFTKLFHIKRIGWGKGIGGHIVKQ